MEVASQNKYSVFKFYAKIFTKKSLPRLYRIKKELLQNLAQGIGGKKRANIIWIRN